MERTKPPPHDESPEETGARIIQELLDTPEPPPTLEEDLLETSARIAHRNIAIIQVEMATKKFHLRQKIASQTEQYLAERPSMAKEEQKTLVEAASTFARKQVSELREHTLLLITALHVEREHRDASIRTFCRGKTPPSPFMPIPERHSIAPAA